MTYDKDLSKINSAPYMLHSLSIYRNLLKDPVISSFKELLENLGDTSTPFTRFLDSYNSFFYAFISSGASSFKEYIIEKVLYDENPFTTGAERGLEIPSFKAARAAAAEDLAKLEYISSLSSRHIKDIAIGTYSSRNGAALLDTLPCWDLSEAGAAAFPCCSGKNILPGENWSSCIDNLQAFHRSKGTGDFSRFSAFKWEPALDGCPLRGISTPDPIRLSELIEYEAEREVVIKNTEQFLKGFKANNILLYGDRGTGKSSCVKAVLNEYESRGLRLVEVSKAHLADFPKIIDLLRNRSQKFIIFVDDLAFEDNEENYTALKAILEGGVEVKPSNVLIYATSNRRHLIKEKFSDRTGLLYGNAEDEVRANDSIQEKLSLADRFGITVVFSSPDKKRYLEIVEGLARQRNLEISIETLHREALKWELWYNGRSPRTAKQFIDWLEGEMKGQD